VRDAVERAGGDWQSMKRELAVICGGPGKPREGESEVAYWLRRMTAALAAEHERAVRDCVEALRDPARMNDAKWAGCNVRATDDQPFDSLEHHGLVVDAALDAAATILERTMLGRFR
jgi:hypothetical protein